VVAVSQAPSPESSPDSPLPVITMVGHDPTITVDRSEIRMARRQRMEGKMAKKKHENPPSVKRKDSQTPPSTTFENPPTPL